MVAHFCKRAPQEQVWRRHSSLPPGKRRSPWPWVRETLGKQDSLPWHAQQAGGKTSVIRSPCREMEACLLSRHEETTRAGARAPLRGRSLCRRQACPVALVPKGKHLLGHLSQGQTWACHQVPNPELTETTPWRNGQSDATFHQDVAALRVAGGVPGQEWRQSPTVHHPSARAVSRDPVASSLLW